MVYGERGGGLAGLPLIFRRPPIGCTPLDPRQMPFARTLRPSWLVLSFASILLIGFSLLFCSGQAAFQALGVMLMARVFNLEEKALKN